MEPEIEKITGDERDTNTFMKMMRMFNEVENLKKLICVRNFLKIEIFLQKVSSKQQEMEIKFELMKKTLALLKKYEEHEVTELENKYNGTPLRWTNLKSKVTQAKQRLGPTIHEEFRVITKVFKLFFKFYLRLQKIKLF